MKKETLVEHEFEPKFDKSQFYKVEKILDLWKDNLPGLKCLQIVDWLKNRIWKCIDITSKIEEILNLWKDNRKYLRLKNKPRYIRQGKYVHFY